MVTTLFTVWSMVPVHWGHVAIPPQKAGAEVSSESSRQTSALPPLALPDELAKAITTIRNTNAPRAARLDALRVLAQYLSGADIVSGFRLLIDALGMKPANFYAPFGVSGPLGPTTWGIPSFYVQPFLAEGDKRTSLILKLYPEAGLSEEDTEEIVKNPQRWTGFRIVEALISDPDRIESPKERKERCAVLSFISERLWKPVSIDMHSAPLREVVELVSGLGKLPITIDQGISSELPVTIKLEKVTLFECVFRIAESVGLSVWFRDRSLVVGVPLWEQVCYRSSSSNAASRETKGSPCQKGSAVGP